MPRPLVKPEFYTYADYYSWPEAIRGELIDGQFYAMTPSPSSTHQAVVGNLFAQLHAFFSGTSCRVFIAPLDVRFPRPGDEEGMERDVVQPDIAVICDGSKIDDRGCRGAPDWIIEVLSPGTQEKDSTLKRGLYERDHVPLYWMVSPRGGNLTVLRLSPSNHYPAPETRHVQGRLSVAEYPGLEVDWDRVFLD